MGKLGFWLFFIFIRLMDIFVGVILLVIIIDLLVGGSVLFWGVDGGIWVVFWWGGVFWGVFFFDCFFFIIMVMVVWLKFVILKIKFYFKYIKCNIFG